MVQLAATSPPSTEEIAELLSALQDRAVDPKYLHTAPASSLFPGLLVVGEQVTTHAASLQAVVLWDEHGAELGRLDDMAQAAMARAGWAGAESERRQNLAMEWVRSVELSFAGTTQDKDMKIFGKGDRASFHLPAAESLPDGGVEVCLWFREVEWGKSSTRDFCRLRLRFSIEGKISDREREDCFSVPNQEWRKAL